MRDDKPRRDTRYYPDPVDYTIDTLQSEVDRLRAELQLADAETARLKEIVEEGERERLALVDVLRENRIELVRLREQLEEAQ